MINSLDISLFGVFSTTGRQGLFESPPVRTLLEVAPKREADFGAASLWKGGRVDEIPPVSLTLRR